MNQPLLVSQTPHVEVRNQCLPLGQVWQLLGSGPLQVAQVRWQLTHELVAGIKYWFEAQAPQVYAPDSPWLAGHEVQWVAVLEQEAQLLLQASQNWLELTKYVFPVQVPHPIPPVTGTETRAFPAAQVVQVAALLHSWQPLMIEHGLHVGPPLPTSKKVPLAQGTQPYGGFKIKGGSQVRQLVAETEQVAQGEMQFAHGKVDDWEKVPGRQSLQVLVAAS